MPAGYYTVLHLSAADVNRLFGTLLEARRLFQQRGLTAQADQVALIYRQAEQEFRRIERDIARIATESVRRRIQLTAKRPDGGRVSGNLADHVLSAPLPSTPPIAGIGIGSLAELDKVVNPNRTSKVAYWRAQEEGSRAAVGRELTGLYYGAGFGGGSPPSQALFRQHPLFRVGRGPTMRIRRPIQARHFLRDGSADAEAVWRLQLRVAERRIATQIDALVAGTPVPRTAAERRAARERARRLPAPRRPL
jgi:hypothetical protein